MTTSPKRTAGLGLRVVAALGRVEARRLLTHPAFLVGVALATLAFWVLGPDVYGDNAWADNGEGVALTLVLLGWPSIVGANLGALRSRRSKTQELLSTYPVDEEARTAGHLLATPWAGAAAIVLVVLNVGLINLFRGSTGFPHLGPVALGAVIVVGGAVVGVFVARWLPAIGFGFLAIVVVTFLQGVMGTGTVGNRRTYLAFIPNDGEVLPGWELADHHLAHLAYLVGWVALVAIGALSRRRWSSGRTWAAGAATLVVVATAVVQLRPMPPAEAAAHAATLTDPASVQTCHDVNDIEYCAYAHSVALIEDWAATVDGVSALAPEARRPEQVTQRAEYVSEGSDCEPRALPDQLPYEVARLTPADEVWAEDGEIHPGLGRENLGCSDDDEETWLYLGVQAGSYAVGLPPTDHDGGRRCEADGQARAVAALWLGAEASGAAGRLEDMAADFAHIDHLDFVGNGPTIDRSGWSVPPPWGTRFLRTDVVAALRLMQLPADDVAGVLTEHWEEITDPSTSTATLLAWAGADPAEARPSGTEPEAASPCA